jgi:hypothetical protein
VTISVAGTPDRAAAGLEGAAVDLYWLPLGAGGQSVRLNGRLFEAVAARATRRPACDLYHSALAVGIRWGARFRIFRYEIRRWRDGQIPDVDEAVESPRRLTDEQTRAQRVLDLVPQVPTPVWGRDELETGDMWNSNSVIAWLIARSGMDIESIHPPASGRAPGWQAGLVVARRQEAEMAPAHPD